MKRIVFIVFSVVCSPSIWGQYTDIINSNQPGRSQSAYAVGTKVLQFEGGLWFEQRNHKKTYTDMTMAGLNYSARYGILSERLEVMLDGTIVFDHTEYYRFTTVKSNHFGFYNNTIGAKYLIYNPYFESKPNLYSWNANHRFQWRNLIPAIAVYAGMNFLPNERYFYKDVPTLSPKIVASFQSHPMPRIVLVANLIANRFTSEYPEWGYIFTLTHNIDNGRFSVFVESEGIQSDWYSDHILRLGGAYLFTKDVQVNVDLGAGWKDTPQRYMALLGFSYRIDKHDKYLPEETEKLKPTKIKKKRKFLFF